MIFNLVKKDFLLIKNYLLVLITFTIFTPVLLASKTNIPESGFLGFFASLMVLEYMLFSSISISEDKYKGAALLCTTPYTRSSLIKSKYIFIFIIFIFICLIYTITSFLSPIEIEYLSILNMGFAFFIVSIYFSLIIPIQYKFGYEKTRYISSMTIMIFPFILPKVIDWLEYTDILVFIETKIPSILIILICYFSAILIAFFSMILSVKIYSKQDL